MRWRTLPDLSLEAEGLKDHRCGFAFVGQLRLDGVTVGRRRVARLMREGGVQGRSARLYRHSKVLQRAFYAGVPYLPESASTQAHNQVWVGDVT